MFMVFRLGFDSFWIVLVGSEWFAGFGWPSQGDGAHSCNFPFQTLVRCGAESCLMLAAKVAVVADEVLNVPDVLKHFVSKDEYLVAAEVQPLEVVELVEDPGGELAEVVVGEVELLQVWQVVEGGRGDGADVVPVEHQLLQGFQPVEVVVNDVGDVVRGEVQASKGGKTPQSPLPNIGNLMIFLTK